MIIMEELYQVHIMISKEVIIAISNLVTLNLVILALPKTAKLVEEATIANLVTMLSHLKYLAGTDRKTRNRIRKQKIITIRKIPVPLPDNVKVVPVLAARKKTGNQHPP